MMPPLERRRVASQATIDRFGGLPLDWVKNDCARMALFHLRQFKIKIPVAKAGKWSSPLGAKRALKRMGVTSLSELASAHLPEIAPAAALIGDIIIVPGTDEFEAVWIALGNHAALGWHEDAEGAAIVRMNFTQTRAWRTI